MTSYPTDSNMKFTFEFSDENNNVVVMEPDNDQESDVTLTRKYTSKVGTCRNPRSVARRNARERRRIKNVNSAFDELRLHVPNGEVNRKKISKVRRVVSSY